VGNTPLAVEIHGLTFRYPDGTPALLEVELQVPEGERLALIGPNGAGKSTLLLHLNGLLRGEGVVRVLGQPCDAAHLGALRRQVGLVFQDPDDQLFMPTVFDEVAYGALNAGYDAAAVRTRVADALRTAGLEGLERRSPTLLSLGQRKRVAIASVLVTDNRLLALDEPSAGLDPPGRQSLIALLQALPATMLIATHDLEFAAALCSRAVAVRGGRLSQPGPLAEVVRQAFP
jgi:cobalt/nickel transport system ATP-binding protein